MKIKKKYINLILILLFTSCVTPGFLSRKSSNKKEDISFWLQKTDNPDKIILTTDQIIKINKKISRGRYLNQPLREGSVKKGYLVKRIIARDLKFMYGFKKYNINNIRLRNKEFKRIINPLMALNKIPQTIKTRFCLIVNPAYLRSFPTYNAIMSKPDDLPFDTLQRSFLDIGEPLALYHISKDGKWGFVLSTHSHGWVQLKHLAWTYNKKIIKNYTSASDFVMATDWRVSIYTDKDLDIICSTIHMGTKVPLIKKTGNYFVVQIPYRDEKGGLQFQKGYIKNDSTVSMKYLKMTPRNIAQQSFKMLGEPYSWGGANFNTDCSYFIKVVFRTMGLDLPRNSYAQIKSLKNFRVYKKNKNIFLNSMEPFQTLLFNPDPSHIMLYIGKHNDQYYVIHNKWSYKEKNGPNEEEEIFIKKTLVSDLSLGKNSHAGSLLEKVSRAGVLQ